MTTTSKTALSVGILAVVVLAGGFALHAHDEHREALGNSSAAPSGTLTTSASDTSDEALAQDAAVIDAQMNGLHQDNAAVDSSVNAQGQ